jgi:hypothetical protein
MAIDEIIPGAGFRFNTLGRRQVEELEEFASLARAFLESKPEGERVRKDFVEDQLRLVRKGVRDVRLHDVTCVWVTSQPKYRA